MCNTCYNILYLYLLIHFFVAYVVVLLHVSKIWIAEKRCKIMTDNLKALMLMGADCLYEKWYLETEMNQKYIMA